MSGEWIPVAEQPPTNTDEVLVCNSRTGELLVGYWDGAQLWDMKAGEPRPLYDATHWMPLPAPPGWPDDSDDWRNEAIYSARE
jgi:hypothetical protein